MLDEPECVYIYIYALFNAYFRPTFLKLSIAVPSVLENPP